MADVNEVYPPSDINIRCLHINAKNGFIVMHQPHFLIIDIF